MVRTTRRAVALVAAGGLAAGLLALGAPASADSPVFRLQLLHASDLEGGVDAIGRAPNFAAIIDRLEDAPGMDASLTVSAGDNVIPGPFFAAASDSVIQPTLRAVFNEFYGLPDSASGGYNDLRAGGGRIDYSVMNVIEFDASALGNHEFDLGSDLLEDNIRPDLRNPAGPPGDRWMGVQFPYLSANLDFSGDAQLAPVFTDELRTTASYQDAPQPGPTPSNQKRVAPYALADEGGQLIGIVGATTPILESISSPTGTTVIGPKANDMPALAAVLQPAINTVLGAGANKVVLVSHLQQVALEAQLATLLTGVDVIVAGGSDTILANPDDTLRDGDVAAGAYPLVTTSASGDPVAIVSTDGEYSYVGRLVVDFDAAGILVNSLGAPITSEADLDLTLNGPVATTPEQVAAVWGVDDPFATGTKGELVSRLVNSVTGVVIAKDANVVGETEVFIDGRRSEVRTQETTMGNLSADANLWVAQQYDSTVMVSIKNGGGIRAEIGEVVNQGDTTLFLPPQENPLSGKEEGEVSQLDIENSLRFNNLLTVVKTTAEGLVALVEHGVAATAPGATPGQFPQIGGMSFSFDPTMPPGNRVQSLVLANGDVVVFAGELQGDPMREIGVVTLNFLAGGGDSYPFPAVTLPGSRVDLNTVLTDPGEFTFAIPGSEQDAFAEYFGTLYPEDGSTPFDTPDTPPSEDLRIQNLSARMDTVVTPDFAGTDGADRINGTPWDDVIFGYGGNDRLDGKAGPDIIVGGMGNDELRGGDGDDFLVGNEGDDTFFGGDGADRILIVGGGNDRVVAFDLMYDTLLFQGAFADADEFMAATRTVRGAAVIELPDGGTVTVQGRKASDLVPGVNVTL